MKVMLPWSLVAALSVALALAISRGGDTGRALDVCRDHVAFLKAFWHPPTSIEVRP